MSEAGDSASQAAERSNPSDDLNLKMLVCKIKIPHVAHNGMYISSVRTPRANRVQRGQSQGDFPQLLSFLLLVIAERAIMIYSVNPSRRIRNKRRIP
jgi:hypothetical protein